jgi:glycosyltransferase involved in cell wall biosynthesis
MRVLQVITQDRGGPVDHAVDVAVELAALGLDSHLSGPPGAYPGRLAGTGATWHELAVRTKHDVAGARQLGRLMRSVQPDVVHLQDRRAGLHGRVLARVLGLPSVYTLHGVADAAAHLIPGNLRVAPLSGHAGAARTAPESVFARLLPGRIVTPCAALADYAIRRVHVPPRSVTVVPNGVGPQWFRPRRRTDRSGATTVAWLGVMAPVKRVPALVRAAAGVAELRLLLIGDGPQRPDVERAIAECGLRDRVELTGFVDDPYPLLARASAFVLPSAAEACPMALLQAMAAGLPVIASAAGGIPEIVRHEVDGLLVPTGDDTALRGALRRVVQDAELRSALGCAARQRIAEGFTLRSCTERLVAVYEDAVSSRGAVA